MDQTIRFQEILRKLEIIDEGLVADQAGAGARPAQVLAAGSQALGRGTPTTGFGPMTVLTCCYVR